MRLIEHAVSHIHHLAGRDIHKQQVWSVAHPLVARRRRRQPETRPPGIKIIRCQKQRRQQRADGPTPIRPAVRINEGRDMDPVDRMPAVDELCSRRMRTAESRNWGSMRHRPARWRSMRMRPVAAGRRWSLSRRQCRQGERKHRGNSNCAQHSELRFLRLRRSHRIELIKSSRQCNAPRRPSSAGGGKPGLA
jgi:hypothetical protein